MDPKKFEADKVQIQKHEMEQFMELENEIAIHKEKYFDMAMSLDNTKEKVRQLTIQKIQYIEKIKQKYKIEGKNFHLDFENNTITIK